MFLLQYVSIAGNFGRNIPHIPGFSADEGKVGMWKMPASLAAAGMPVSPNPWKLWEPGRKIFM
jgi:hypothetical protein